MTFAITVTGKDQHGIIADLTEALYRSGGNLEDASMTILEGEFAMIFLATLLSNRLRAQFEKRLKQLEQKRNLVISTQEIKYRLVRGEKHRKGTVPWVVSVLGKDRAGIVYYISKLLANRKLNITDVNSKIIGKGPKTIYALVLEVDVPRNQALISQLKKQFEKLQKKLKFTVTFKPLESSSF